VRTALAESLQVSHGYLEEHRNTIRSDALEMANDLTRAGQFLAADPSVFVNVLDTQTTLRGLTEAVIYEPNTGQILAAAGLFVASASIRRRPRCRVSAGRRRCGDEWRRRHAGSRVAKLNATRRCWLMIGRRSIRRSSATWRAPSRRSPNTSAWIRALLLQIAFAWIFAVVALLVLLAAALIGLVMANQIARPIGTLINATERVRGGDLGVRVTEGQTRDELAGLSRAFNRMTGQLAAQRAELMEAYSQIDGRRRFTETVLAGVSAA